MVVFLFQSILTEPAKLDIDRMDLQPGKYSAEVSFQTDRADIQDEDIIKAETVTSNIDFEIN